MDPRTRILILGSLPGEESIARRQYYANPRNQFWRLLGEVIQRPLVPLGYDERLAALLQAGIGLWDVVAIARRDGSLDGNIRDHEANDLEALVASLPALRAVAFNGGTSARLGQRQLPPRRGLILIPLPSSSPAFTLAFDRKLVEWRKLQPFLGEAV